MIVIYRANQRGCTKLNGDLKNIFKENVKHEGLKCFLHVVNLQSRTLNFATSAGAMNRFAPTKVAKFNVRDCICNNSLSDV